MAWCTDSGKDSLIAWYADIGKYGLMTLVCRHWEGWSYDLGVQTL